MSGVSATTPTAAAEGAPVSLPTGGGAVRGMGETFQTTPFSGTGSFTVPLAMPPGRDGFGPELSLEYSSGNGNGAFGLGWQLSVPRVTRRTERGLPRYQGDDVFVMSGSEELVRCLVEKSGAAGPEWEAEPAFTCGAYQVTLWRPRTEADFARIERWELPDGDVHWRATSRDNVTSVFGRTAASRIMDSSATGAARVFEWLLDETFDARGNHSLYEYALEDGPAPGAVWEKGRAYNQLYLRRILFGNSHAAAGPRRAVPDLRSATPDANVERRYLYEVVFDYGAPADPTEPPAAPGAGGRERTSDQPAAWALRPDPHSSYRAGFEIRTMRRCSGVRVFHHFPELGGRTLVRSFELRYANDGPGGLSLLESVTARGHRWDDKAAAWRVRDMPPVTFEYAGFEPGRQRFQPLTARGGEMPSSALGQAGHVLVDLYGEGLPGILEGGAERLRFWRNLGGGRLDRPHPLHLAPLGGSLSSPAFQFADMDGDGRVELLVQGEGAAGFFEADGAGGWRDFQRFEGAPSLDPADPNVRMVDLTGDGRTDLLVSREHHFLWYEGAGLRGFVEGGAIERIHDLDAFPDVHFDQAGGRIRLADMNGDGLADIVRLHEGAVEYWPSLGYGRFGARVRMGAVPDTPQLAYDFDPDRLFLADLDGDGCCDLVYVEFDRVHYWINRSGDQWSERRTIRGTPPAVGPASIQFADVFGNGTATLLWSYDHATYPGSNYKALDFCGGVKPYVLTGMHNGLGATTRVEYAPSTRFAAGDAARGEPWVTNLPFPVQVVARVETIDHVGRTRIVNRYSYHHGYFDGEEREFRGFGRVDQYDTEEREIFAMPGLHGAAVGFDNGAAEHHVPPVLTRTWYHTGAAFADGRLLEERLRREFFAGDASAFELPAHRVDPAGSTRDALRALRGNVMRTEVYGLDGSAQAAAPYAVTTTRYHVRALQPAHGAARAVHHTVPVEQLVHQYERDPADPRVSHDLSLDVDRFGNVTRRLAVSYPRRGAATHPEQQRMSVLLFVDSHVNTPEFEPASSSVHYVGLPCEERRFEVTSAAWNGRALLRPADLTAALLDPADHVSFGSAQPATGKRLLSWSRTYYRKDAGADVLDAPDRLDHRLPLGRVEPRGLRYDDYRAAFTAADLDAATQSLVTASELPPAGYHAEADAPGLWWVPTGRRAYRPDGFFLPGRTMDPFGAGTALAYDAYDLNVVSAIDRAGVATTAVHDYRVMQPRSVTDPNGTRRDVLFDAVGLVAATAVSGPGGAGDSLDGLEPDLDPAVIRAHLDNPLTDPRSLLGKATTRVLHDLRRFHDLRDPSRPVAVLSILRETHVSEEAGQPSRLQLRILYGDGFGRDAQSRTLAEPGPLAEGPGEPVVAPRWLASGWTIYDNKDQPVLQFEPFFSDTAAFEYAAVRGVSSIVFRDALGRVCATVHPDASYEKTVRTGWQETTWDRNDTASLDPRTDPDVRAVGAAWLAGLPATWQTWMQRRVPAGYDVANPPNERQRSASEDVAVKTFAHAATPTMMHLDALGRGFLTISDNAAGRTLETLQELDVDGNLLRLTDPRGLIAFAFTCDMLQRKLRVESMDAGTRCLFPDAVDMPLVVRDGAGRIVRTRCDVLRRAIEIHVQEPGTATPRLVMRTIFGEELPAGARVGHLGRIYRIHDGAGVVTHESYDLNGNLARTSRRLTADPLAAPDWSVLTPGMDVAAMEQAAEALLEPATARSVLTTSHVFDAIGRIRRSTAPDGSVRMPRYDQRGGMTSLVVAVEGDTTATREFVRTLRRDARGQRLSMTLGNGVSCTYGYDAQTFRLLRTTVRDNSGSMLHDLQYTVDAVGNITRLTDGRCTPVFHGNAQVGALGGYTYDALYRLVQATGREHQAATPCMHRHRDSKRTAFQTPVQPIENCQALRLYTQFYRYDDAGNLEEMRHVAHSGSWTRTQQYDRDSAGAPRSNRLTESRAGCHGEPGGPMPHDGNGNMLALDQLTGLEWDHAGCLVAVTIGPPHGGVPHRMHCQYDGAGTRIRKVEVKGGERFERIYIGDYEIYRHHTAAGVTDSRETLHVSDGTARIALVEKRPAGAAARDLRVRFQLDNHLGSSLIELDDAGTVITYEEFHPYGSTAYLAGDNETVAKRKRYRYAGKEMDDETGLIYYGARYYAPWMGRWISPDPLFLVDGPNGYVFTACNPIVLTDPDGRYTWATTEEQAKLIADALQRDVVKNQGKLYVEPHEDYVKREDPSFWQDKTEKKLVGYRIRITLNEKLPSNAQNGSRTGAELLDMTLNDPDNRIVIYADSESTKKMAADWDRRLEPTAWTTDLCEGAGCGEAMDKAFGGPAIVVVEPNAERYKDFPLPIATYDEKTGEEGLPEGTVPNSQGTVILHEVVGHAYGFAIDGGPTLRDQDFAVLVEDTARVELGMGSRRLNPPKNYNKGVGIEDLKAASKAARRPANYAKTHPVGESEIEKMYQPHLFGEPKLPLYQNGMKKRQKKK